MVSICKKLQKEKYIIKRGYLRMNITKTNLDKLVLIEPKVFADERGWFTESYSKRLFNELGYEYEFIQDNHSFSAQRGTLRGLHFQLNPKAQTKLVRCTKGRVLDVSVDLRKGSSTYKKWFAVELTKENKRQILVPKSFAHGFLTLTDNVEIQYKVDEYYDPKFDRSIKFNDPEIGIDWGIEKPILSEKDLYAPLLKDSDANFSIKVLVTGAEGQLGGDVVQRLNEIGIENKGVDKNDFDLTNKQNIWDYVMNYKPDVIIHCAAYTAVDKAEEEKELCYSVNVKGTRYLAEVAEAIEAIVVFISTDYVFDGCKEKPYSENNPTEPVNYYGYTKEQGEKIISELLDKFFIVRTSWLYGKHGDNFVKKMLKLAESKNEINVVSDQVGAPTYSKDLAVLIGDMIQTQHYGYYHGVNEGCCSWADFAEAIFIKAGLKVRVNPILSSDYQTKATRPVNSKLAKTNLDHAGLKRLPEWENALERYLDDR
jgi:dTDP-4-dehydrorhamnose 3,5-epimerase/reductase